MNYLKLTTDKLDINLVNDLVSHESCGAVSLFVGTTRDNFEEKTVSHRNLFFLLLFFQYNYVFF